MTELIIMLAAGVVAGMVQLAKRLGVQPLYLVAIVAFAAAAIWEQFVPGPLQADLIARFGVIAATATGIYEFSKFILNTKKDKAADRDDDF